MANVARPEGLYPVTNDQYYVFSTNTDRVCRTRSFMGSTGFDVLEMVNLPGQVATYANNINAKTPLQAAA